MKLWFSNHGAVIVCFCFLGYQINKVHVIVPFSNINLVCHFHLKLVNSNFESDTVTDNEMNSKLLSHKSIFESIIKVCYFDFMFFRDS